MNSRVPESILIRQGTLCQPGGRCGAGRVQTGILGLDGDLFAGSRAGGAGVVCLPAGPAGRGRSGSAGNGRGPRDASRGAVEEGSWGALAGGGAAPEAPGTSSE